MRIDATFGGERMVFDGVKWHGPIADILDRYTQSHKPLDEPGVAMLRGAIEAVTRLGGHIHQVVGHTEPEMTGGPTKAATKRR